MAQRTVAVTGATGFVGRHIVSELLRRGSEVRALVRDPAKAEAVLGRRDGLSHVRGDVLERETLGALLEGADACVHLIGIIREAPGGQTFERMHVQATRAVLDACERAGVRRYAHMSALGVGPEGVCDYQRTKWEAERHVHSSGLDWTVFRPSLIHGADGEFTQMVAGWVRGKGVPGAFIPYFSRSVEDTRVILGPVHQEDPVVAPLAVEDVACCFAEALEREAAIGEIYNLAGPDRMPFPEMLRRFRDAVPGAKHGIEPRAVPERVAARVARVARALRMEALLPFDEGMALMGGLDSVAEPDKAEAHLHWTPSPFQERLQAYAHSL